MVGIMCNISRTFDIHNCYRLGYKHAYIGFITAPLYAVASLYSGYEIITRQQ